MTKEYLEIAKHYDKCFKEHGLTHKGVDWPNKKDLENRFKVMLEVTKYQTPKDKEINLLDLGCGFGLFLDFIEENKCKNRINYHGIDILESMIETAKKRWPQERFTTHDILINKLDENSYDYVIMNGLLTEKVSLDQTKMIEFAKDIIKTAFISCKIGLAFNVMNYHVDWHREDLFHWPFDNMAEFLRKECGKNYIIRSDYGLYEYTVYLFKSPNE